MAVSILHRITGVGLAVAGGAMFVWWLVALASGPEAYATFVGWATWKWMLVIWVGLTWAAFQHTLSGLRHFVLDIGAGYELKTNKFWSVVVLIGGLALTMLVWALIYLRNFA
jgi:succinate dehydrogenase / fumarate reductase cytochrome b subunit